MNLPTSDFTGVILAGGQAKRMGGKDKALISVDGERIIDRLISTIKQVTSDIIIISNSEEDYGTNLPVFKDIYLRKGPIGGIHSALAHASSENCLVLGCDMPYISFELINYIVQHSKDVDVVVPMHDGTIEPLCAMYNMSIFDEVEDHIRTDRLKLQGLLADLDTKFIEINSNLTFYNRNLFANINTPGDLKNTLEK
ncbi:MAG: molybdenum cofactor guanylyltransferase [Bacteroidetes bacterium]|nr:molybdenum cofactor guanylyltransferase [Bacteroidota bacterium]